MNKQIVAAAGRHFCRVFVKGFFVFARSLAEYPALCARRTKSLPFAIIAIFRVLLTNIAGSSAKDPAAIENGAGISDAIKEKIMQPFFATKPTGERTGLGLSLTYEMVVKGHGGSIKVESIEGQGSEFILKLLVPK